MKVIGMTALAVFQLFTPISEKILFVGEQWKSRISKNEICIDQTLIIVNKSIP